MKKQLVYITFLILFSSCKKELSLKSDEEQPRIVVNSIFTGEEKIKIYLKESVSILEQANTSNISDADITVTDENGNEPGDFSSGSFYGSDFYTEAGKAYFLNISVDGFESVQASTSVPQLAPLAGIDTTILHEEQKIIFDIFLNDDPAQENYYSVKINYLSGDNDFSTNSIIAFGHEESNLDGEKIASEFFFSDETFNGEVFKFTGFTEYFPPFFGWEYYIVEVRSLSEELYNYKRSYYNYLKAQELPFTEPVQIYSNIENGIGIFAGQSVLKDTVWLD